MVIMVKLYKLDNYIWEEHFDAVGRLLVVVATAWLFFFWLDMVFAFWLAEEQELTVWRLRLFHAPWSWLFLMFIVFSYVIPVPLWLSRNVRRNMTLMLITTIMVNVGMWLERFIIVVPSIMQKQPLTFDYASYRPSPVEITIVGGTFALVGFLILLFSKFFPLIPLWEAKEGQVLWDEIQVGRVKVPGIIKEE